MATNEIIWQAKWVTKQKVVNTDTEEMLDKMGLLKCFAKKDH